MKPNLKITLAAAAILIVTGLITLQQTGAFNRPKPHPEQPKEIAKKPANPQPAQTGMAPIPLHLPDPIPGGTPSNISKVKNLEKLSGNPRPKFYAPIGTKNIALGKPVTASDPFPVLGTIDQITDGDKHAEGSLVELGPFEQHITIDLGAKHDIYAIAAWHYYKMARVYFDVVVQVSDDPDFITNVVTLFNNDHDNSLGFGAGKDKNYIETNEGKLIDVKGVQARYVRLYSNGNHDNEMNHYIEVEIYGKHLEQK